MVRNYSENAFICLAVPIRSPFSEPSVGSAMTAGAREQNEEESIKGTVVCWTSLTWSCLAEWSAVLLVMTQGGFEMEIIQKARICWGKRHVEEI